MGIYDRDYYRGETSGHFGNPTSRGGVQHWTVWKKIIAITAAFFVLQLLFPIATSWFNLSVETLWQGQIWRLLSYAFMHSEADIFHILFNMLFVYYFGVRLESMYGGKEFGLLYCAAALFAGGFIVLLGLIFQDDAPTIGASGAALALLTVYTMYFPREKFVLFGVIPIEMRWILGVTVIFDLHPVLRQFGGVASTDGISHAGHVGGALFGYLYYRFGLRLSPWVAPLAKFTNFKMPGGRSKLKIYHEETSEELDSEVDRILQKIKEKGEESLTRKERKILKNASEHYKKKQ